MKFASIRFKSTILFSSILFIILIIFSITIFLTVQHILFKELDNILKIKALEVAETVNKTQGFPIFPMVIDKYWLMKVENLNLKSDYINIVNLRGVTILHSNNFSDDVRDIFVKQMTYSPKRTFYKTIRNFKYQIRVINLPVIKNNFSHYVVILGTSLRPINQTLNQLFYFLAISIITVLILTSFLGLVLTRSILKPVTEVSQMANTISYKNLNQRISEIRADDEMKFLINSFNAMISRLENSFKHINEFSQHVAHELKTPLAIMKGEVEVALQKKHQEKEYKHILNSSLEEINRLNRIIKDILLLANLEYKQDIFNFEPFNLINFIKEIGDNSRILAKKKKIRLDLSIPEKKILINGDRVHLRRLFFNVMHNAVKFTPRSGKINLSVLINQKKAYITITDTGPGIPKEDLEKIFHKFYRSEKHEHIAEKGSGLGLNIAQTIAQAHQGDIKVKSKTKGSAFTIILPVIQ